MRVVGLAFPGVHQFDADGPIRPHEGRQQDPRGARHPPRPNNGICERLSHWSSAIVRNRFFPRRIGQNVGGIAALRRLHDLVAPSLHDRVIGPRLRLKFGYSSPDESVFRSLEQEFVFSRPSRPASPEHRHKNREDVEKLAESARMARTPSLSVATFAHLFGGWLSRNCRNFCFRATLRGNCGRSSISVTAPSRAGFVRLVPHPGKSRDRSRLRIPQTNYEARFVNSLESSANSSDRGWLAFNRRRVRYHRSRGLRILAKKGVSIRATP
jgi:hypothetical protein